MYEVTTKSLDCTWTRNFESYNEAYGVFIRETQTGRDVELVEKVALFSGRDHHITAH